MAFGSSSLSNPTHFASLKPINTYSLGPSWKSRELPPKDGELLILHLPQNAMLPFALHSIPSHWLIILTQDSQSDPFTPHGLWLAESLNFHLAHKGSPGPTSPAPTALAASSPYKPSSM